MKRHVAPLYLLILMAVTTMMVSCRRDPILHFHKFAALDLDMPIVALSLDTYWQYDIDYDWDAEWHYGWDDTDRYIFGELGYTDPEAFHLRRYFLGDDPNAKHTEMKADFVVGTQFKGNYKYGWYDMLVWSDVETLDGVQALIFDESNLDNVYAYTNYSHVLVNKYPQLKSEYAVYQPELLLVGGRNGEHITNNPDDYDHYDEELECYVRKIDMKLQPVTYIYLTQVLIKHNNGKITNVEGSANFSGMSHGVSLNTAMTDTTAVSVNYGVRFKKDITLTKAAGDVVDVVGGRLLTFGMCGINPHALQESKAALARPDIRNYMDMKMIFANGLDSTFVFDVTDQVQKLFRGGVITVEMDMDTIPVPKRPGGSAFDAVVLDPEEEIHEIEM